MELELWSVSVLQVTLSLFSFSLLSEHSAVQYTLSEFLCNDGSDQPMLIVTCSESSYKTALHCNNREFSRKTSAH